MNQTRLAKKDCYLEILIKEETLFHRPVLAREVIEGLDLENGDIIVDCTLGCGGHAERILEKIAPQGRLIGLDLDDSALKEAQKKLKRYYPGSLALIKGNYSDIDSVLSELGIEKIDGALFDLGVSSLQLGDARRGFGIQKDGPLDMRMDTSAEVSAFDIVNRLKGDALYKIIRDYGEERYARRITHFIVAERRKKPITRTSELAGIIVRVLGSGARRQKIHPATRTFQAIRIAVNEELSSLETGLRKILHFLKPGSRVCVISFHSLEDRIVKNIFKEFAKRGELKIVTKKPVRPAAEEITINPRSRSAKLRIAESIGILR